MVYADVVVPSSLTARSLAARYADDVAAHWREAAADASFDDWLESYWRTDAPPEPRAQPAAVTLIGALGEGGQIRWYETPTTIRGYIPGIYDRCFEVPRSASPPRPARLGAPDGGLAEWKTAVVVSAAGRDQRLSDACA